MRGIIYDTKRRRPMGCEFVYKEVCKSFSSASLNCLAAQSRITEYRIDGGGGGVVKYCFQRLSFLEPAHQTIRNCDLQSKFPHTKTTFKAKHWRYPNKTNVQQNHRSKTWQLEQKKILLDIIKNESYNAYTTCHNSLAKTFYEPCKRKYRARGEARIMDMI